MGNKFKKRPRLRWIPFWLIGRNADHPWVRLIESSKPPHHPELIRDLFEKRGKGWFLASGETDEAECKAGFALKPQERFADALRTIAGLANNKGGYIFFGVRDKTYEFVGLKDETFKGTDSAEFNRVISTSLDPVPQYEITSLEMTASCSGLSMCTNFGILPQLQSRYEQRPSRGSDLLPLRRRE